MSLGFRTTLVGFLLWALFFQTVNLYFIFSGMQQQEHLELLLAQQRKRQDEVELERGRARQLPWTAPVPIGLTQMDNHIPPPLCAKQLPWTNPVPILSNASTLPAFTRHPRQTAVYNASMQKIMDGINALDQEAMEEDKENFEYEMGQSPCMQQRFDPNTGKLIPNQFIPVLVRKPKK